LMDVRFLNLGFEAGDMEVVVTVVVGQRKGSV
jgi:hypothetical protein